MTTTKVRSYRWVWITLASIFGLLLLAIIFLINPWNTGGLVSHPQPVSSYAGALQRIQAFPQPTGDALNPDCRLNLLAHGQKVENVVVLVHGYTNCPKQFEQLGQELYDKGYNVLIAPLPHHGLADRMNTEQEKLTAEEMVAYADDVVDIAQGLGDHVTMAGMSVGGLITAWAAQNRADLDQAVIISPLFGMAIVPDALIVPVGNLMRILPNAYQWWDANDQGKSPPFHAYPRLSTHAVGQMLRLSAATLQQAVTSAPLTKSIAVVTNAADQSVSRGLIAAYLETLRQHNVPDLRTYEFPASLNMDHDIIDPAQKKQRIGDVYPKLIELIAGCDANGDCKAP